MKEARNGEKWRFIKVVCGINSKRCVDKTLTIKDCFIIQSLNV